LIVNSVAAVKDDTILTAKKHAGMLSSGTRSECTNTNPSRMALTPELQVMKGNKIFCINDIIRHCVGNEQSDANGKVYATHEHVKQ
jgi:hypothetical protein